MHVGFSLEELGGDIVSTLNLVKHNFVNCGTMLYDIYQEKRMVKSLPG